MRWLWLGLLVGCAAPVEGTWMEGAGFEWDLFNHRLSHVTWQIDGSDVSLATIGGTSTTGVITELDEGCDASLCSEFPFLDDAIITLDIARTRTRRAALGAVSVDVVATREGVTVPFSVPVQGKVGEVGEVIVSGLVLDTNHPLGEGESSCYQPKNGWHPQRIALEVSDVVVGDGEVSGALTATFEAGASLEAVRECIDTVVDRAMVPMTVDLFAVAGRASEAIEITGDGSWEKGEEQPLPEAADRPWSVANPERVLAGFSKIDFQFHPDSTENQGAYIRQLHWRADPVAGFASGHATNYSPGTQLTGFEYQFTGRVVAVDVGADVERVRIEQTVAAEVDANDLPVLQTFPIP